MLDPHYMPAEYDEERDSFVSVDAAWIAGQPSLVYFFALLGTETRPGPWEGCLVKLWSDDKGTMQREFHAFAVYADEDAFANDTDYLLEVAQEMASQDNLDYLLALLDILKARAVALGLAEPAILDLEGLFEAGPEDAYTLHDRGDAPRLHDHVECDDECCYLHVSRVVDADQQALGWGLFAVDFLDLTSEASIEEVRSADVAHILLLDQHPTERDAKLAKRAFTIFMDTERLEDPEYAYTNDTDVLAGLATEAEWDEQTDSYIWEALNGDALHAFLAGTAPFVYPREKWKPRQQSMVDKFFEQFPQPVWFEDQLRTALDQQAGVNPELDEDSPWNRLTLD